MQVKNIECQIAQAQLRRYLTGEELPSAVVGDLETHLKHCPECMAAAQRQREALKGTLVSKVTGRKVEPAPAAKETIEQQALEQAVRTGQAAIRSPMDVFDQPDHEFKPTKTIKGKSSLKTLAYSGALALVLVLMSTVFRDPTKLFGPRASTAKQDTPPVSETQKPEPSKPAAVNETKPPVKETTTPEATRPPETDAKPALESNGFIVADSVTGTKVVDDRPKPKVAEGNGTIKVYPPDGK